MFNFDGYRLQELAILWSEYSGQPHPEEAECPPSDHQHIRLVWIKDGFPAFSIHTVGNPDDGSDWKIHSQTELLQAQNAMAFLQETFNQAGVDMKVVQLGPDGELPAIPTADTNDDEEHDGHAGLYL